MNGYKTSHIGVGKIRHCGFSEKCFALHPLRLRPRWLPDTDDEVVGSSIPFGYPARQPWIVIHS